MRLKVRTKYRTVDTYDCQPVNCENCGLKFVCFTERDEAEVEWETFYNVIKGKERPNLLFRKSE